MKKRDLSLNRNENTRRKKKSRVINFELDEIKNHFDENILDIENQFKIIDKLDGDIDKEKIDCILRSQIVFLGSSLDFYLHEITKFGLMKMYEGIWACTPDYNNIQISMWRVLKVLREKENTSWFIEFINSKYKGVTMMSWKSINNQLKLIDLNIDDIVEIADEKINEKRDSSQNRTMEKRIKELFTRRNDIAHQFDRSHNDAIRKEISKEIVADFINDIKEIVSAIHEVASKKE